MKLFETLAFAVVAWGAAGLANAEEVDVQLVLAADVSGSMSRDELRVQREGYVTALLAERTPSHAPYCHWLTNCGRKIKRAED